LIEPEDTDDDGEPDRWYRDVDLDGANDLMVDLGKLPGAESAFARAINENSEIVGSSTRIDSNGDRIHRATLWTLAPPAEEQIEALIQAVLNLNLPKVTQNSLLKKLYGAQEKLEDRNDNNDVAARNMLGAFINKVEAQRGKRIRVADADALIAAALEIIDLISP
jgi:hypothetical protein